MSQLIAGTGPYSLTKSWYVDGTATDVGAVTVGIVDGNGDIIVAAGTSTTNNADGTYTYSLADQANPDQLTVTWTRASGADLVDRLELVGGVLFTEAQARGFGAKDDANTTVVPLKSATEYTDATITDERARITDDLENWTGRAWIPRYARLELAGSGGYELFPEDGDCVTADGYQLNRPGRYRDIAKVLSVTVGGSTVATSNVVIRNGVFRRTDAVWTRPSTSDPVNVVIEYAYGLPNIANGVDRIGLMLLVDRLVPKGIPGRALSWETPDGGSVRLVQPGGPQANVSAVPEVNAWVARNNYNAPFG